METTNEVNKEFKPTPATELVSHFNLQNDSVLICMEGYIKGFTLGLIGKEIQPTNKHHADTITEFFKDLYSNPKIICKVSDKVKTNHPTILVGDTMIVNSYDNPISIVNKKDAFDFENVKNMFFQLLEDDKTKTEVNTQIYKCRVYQIYNANMIVTTISNQ